MVRQGIPPGDLAELLDHTDTQHVLVYYKADSRFVERLDVTVAQRIGPMVKAFMGEVVDSHNKTIDIITYRDLPGIGQCGASFICGLSAPKNCYTCPKFNAFNDSPHDEVLASVVGERDELLAGGYDLLAKQLDLTILAIGEVVARKKGCSSCG